MPELIGETPVQSGFPRISSYGFISDGQTGALIAPDGSVEWLCLPRFDSPSVFGSILDRRAGYFRLGPDDTTVPLARRYDPGTNILETTWMTPSGWLVVHDALTIGPWRGGMHEGWTGLPPTEGGRLPTAGRSSASAARCRSRRSAPRVTTAGSSRPGS